MRRRHTSRGRREAAPEKAATLAMTIPLHRHRSRPNIPWREEEIRAAMENARAYTNTPAECRRDRLRSPTARTRYMDTSNQS
jgi:hypothetical protein